MTHTVALKACTSYDGGALDAALAALLAEIDAWPTLFAGEPVVLLKPNFLMPKSVASAVTTHPAFIAAVARAVRRVHGGRLLLGDGAAVGSSTSIARRIGLRKLTDPLDVQIVNFKETVPVEVTTWVVKVELFPPPCSAWSTRARSKVSASSGENLLSARIRCS